METFVETEFGVRSGSLKELLLLEHDTTYQLRNQRLGRVTMKAYIKHTLFAISICAALLSCSCGASTYRSTTNMPRSHEASLIEISSPCEWLVKAMGISEGHDTKNWNNLADQDARRAAVQFVITGGTDPLLQNAEERQRFEYIKEELFAPSACQQFVVWEAMQYSDRVRYEDPPCLKITKEYKVNRCTLHKHLVDRGVIEEVRPELVGLPAIAVLPEVRTGEDAVEVMLSDPTLGHATTVIENHLTAHRFYVTVLRQRHEIDNVIRQTKLLKEFITDNECIIANAIGSDMYITFALAIDTSRVAGQELRKVTVTIKAYETTTARLLGSETGYSQTSAASLLALCEAAINDAIGKVISRIEGYWKTDLEQGLQYRIHVVFEEDLDIKWKEHVAFIIRDGLRAMSSYTKEVLASENNLDYAVWVDGGVILSTSDLYSNLRSYVDQHEQSAVLQKVLLLRKLGVLSVTRQTGGQ